MTTSLKTCIKRKPAKEAGTIQADVIEQIGDITKIAAPFN